VGWPLGSVIAAQHVFIAVVVRHAHRSAVAVAHGVMGRVETMRRVIVRRIPVMEFMSVAVGHMGRMVVAGMRVPRAEVRMRAIAVERGAIDAGAVIVMVGGVGIAAAIVAIVVRPMTIGVPAGYRAFLIGWNRREVAGTAIARALIGVIILLHRV